MLKAEQGLMWQAHAHKGSAGYPDAVREKAHFLSDRFLGGSSIRSGLEPVGGGAHCESRCLGLLDENEQLDFDEIHDR